MLLGEFSICICGECTVGEKRPFAACSTKGRTEDDGSVHYAEEQESKKSSHRCFYGFTLSVLIMSDGKALVLKL